MAIYYFDSINGNDSWSGTTTYPYRSISKLNSVLSTTTPGSIFYLKRGSEWTGSTITTTVSGTEANPIVIDAYGSGEKPIISGFQTITNWTRSGTTSVYYKVINPQSPPNMVTIDDINTAKGRYPKLYESNAGYLTLDAKTGNTALSDTYLSTAPNWTGAEVVIRVNTWSLEIGTVTSHIGNKITFTGVDQPIDKVGLGYFFQNDFKCLTEYGDWYYNSGTSTFYMHFGSENPTGHTVKVSVVDDCIYCNYRSYSPYSKYYTFNNLILEGANKYGFHINSGTGSTLSNCDIRNLGSFGVYGNCGIDFICSGNTINNSNGGGIGINGYYPFIRNNTITNSGLFAGMCALKGSGIEIIDTSTTGATIEYNTILNTGANGIFPRGSYNLVKNNYISYFGLTIDDCGGIYCSGEFYVGDQIIGNIVTYGMGNRYGLAPSGTTTGTACEGIYMDSVTANKVIVGNTVAHCGAGGIRTHDSYNFLITGNTLYDNRYNIYIVKGFTGSTYSRNITVNNNISVSTTNSTWTQYPYRVLTNYNESPLLFGSSNYNYIMKPITNDVNTFNIEVQGISLNYYNLSTWRAYSSNDLNSNSSPPNINTNSQIRFEFNTGTTNLTIPLTSAYKDVTGTVYSNSVTIEPYSSKILLETGTYFDSISGNDSGSGTTESPYRSIAKMNSILSTIATGSTIYLKRGSEWIGSGITFGKSGTASNPISIDAYGEGNNPIISGFQTLTGWTQSGSTGIWYKTLSPQSTPNVVTVNNIDKEIGRYPKSTYLNIDAYTGTTAISSSSLNSTLTGWTGAEVVIRKNRWILDRCTITNHTGTKITYTGGSAYSPYLNFGFFLQNDLKCLTQVGDWSYSGSTLYMYFGLTNPSGHTVKVSILDKCIDITSRSYLNVNNISLIGANSASINITTSTYININNCDINFSGDYGIKAITTTNYLSLSGNTISNCHNHGLNVQSNSTNTYVGYNNIFNTQLFAGMGKNDDGNGFALTADGHTSVIEYNKVVNSGYLGIHFGGNGTNVRYNVVDTFCSVKDDGSGIYTYSYSPTYITSLRTVNNNIVMNGVGATGGTTGTFGAVNGLYADGYSNLVLFHSNTATNCYLGIHCGFYSRTLTIVNNLFYNNTYQFESTNQISDNVAYTGSTLLPKEFVINNNIFFNRTSNQTCVRINDALNNYPMSDIGTWNGNYYINQFSDDIVANCSFTLSGKPFTVGYSFERWKIDFDTNASNNLPIIPKYTINSLGANLFSNSGFTSNITGLNQNFYWSGNSGISSLTWDGTSKITGTGSAKASIVNLSTGGGNESQTSAILTGGIIAGHNYLVRVKLLGTTENRTIKTLINSTVWQPYQYISFTTTVRSKEYLLTSNDTSAGGRVYFALSDVDGTTYFDDLEIYDANVTLTSPEDYILFEYNSGSTEKTISLSNYYMNVSGDTISNSIVLEPFTSIILMKTSFNDVYKIVTLNNRILQKNGKIVIRN